jgi:PAS domain-containing protein
MLFGYTDLKSLMRMNEAIFESARSPMVVADEKGVILQANLSTSEVFGYSQVLNHDCPRAISAFRSYSQR